MLVGSNVCLSALKGRQKVPTRTVSVTCPAFSPQQNADDLYEDQGYVADTDADADADHLQCGEIANISQRSEPYISISATG